MDPAHLQLVISRNVKKATLIPQLLRNNIGKHMEVVLCIALKMKI
jgi:hypothetical protein